MIAQVKEVGVSEYLQQIKDWKIRKMVADYIEAAALFNETYSRLETPVDFPFEMLEEICNTFYGVKEDHHLIFKRIVGRGKPNKEDAHKIKPAKPEIDFIAVVGMLFHKVLVARELKYIHTHYDQLRIIASNAREELEQAIHGIHALLQEAVPVIIQLVKFHVSNVALLALFVERARRTRLALGISGLALLRRVMGEKKLEATYFLVGKYYLDSGWMDNAEKLFKKILRTNPKHTLARENLEKIRLHRARHNGTSD